VEFAVAAFFGDAKRRKIRLIDDADGFGRREVLVAPSECGANGFRGETFAVSVGKKDPADFGNAFNRGLEIALVFGETGFTKIIAGGFFFNDPVAEAQQEPVSDVAQQASPRFFFGEGFAGDEFGDDGIGPEFGAVGEVGEAVARSLRREVSRMGMVLVRDAGAGMGASYWGRRCPQFVVAGL